MNGFVVALLPVPVVVLPPVVVLVVLPPVVGALLVCSCAIVPEFCGVMPLVLDEFDDPEGPLVHCAWGPVGCGVTVLVNHVEHQDRLMVRYRSAASELRSHNLLEV